MLSISDLQNILMVSKFSILTLVSAAIVHGLLLVVLKRRAKEETLCNVGVYAGYFLVRNYLTGGMTIAGLTFAYHYRLFELPLSILSLLSSVMLADFCYYWKHRWEHTTRILWTAHAPHHSSSEFNLSTALRLPWLAPFYAWMMYVPLCLIGFHPIIVLISISIVLAYQFLIHTEVIKNLGWLEHILNTPSNHRVHHGSNPQYLDKNYAGIFMIWDKMFGTYQKEEEKVIYGLTTPINTANPVKVNTLDMQNLLKDLFTLRAPIHMFKYLFKGPGSY